VEQAATILGDVAEARRYDCGHFEIYGSVYFEESVSDQLAFLIRHLKHG
jgi:hypothetical protein